MRPRGAWAWALVAVLALPRAALAQSLWSRAIAPEAPEVRHLVLGAELDELMAERVTVIRRRTPPDEWAFLGLSPEALRSHALEQLGRAIAHDPGNTRALTTASALCDLLREPARAVDYARRALEHGAGEAEVGHLQTTLGTALTRLERYAEARDAYFEALRTPLDPDDHKVVLGNLGDTFLALRDPQRAVEAFSESVEVDAAYELGWLGLAVARDRTGLDPTDAGDRAVEAANHTMRGRRAHPGAGFVPQALLDALADDGVFFVPAYERHYYDALANEAVARAFLPGGGALESTVVASAYRRRAMLAWVAFAREAPADHPSRERAAAHMRALDAVVGPPAPHPPVGAP